MESYDKGRIGFSKEEADPLYMEKAFYLSTIQIVLCKLAGVWSHQLSNILFL